MAVTGAQAAEYLNETLTKLGYDKQIRTDSDANMIADFQSFGAFPASYLNSILAMQAQIYIRKIFTMLFTESENPMRIFWRDNVDYGGGTSDTFIQIMEAEKLYQSIDFTGNQVSDNALALEIAQDLVKYRQTKVKNKIHSVTDIYKLVLSQSDTEVATIFTPEGYANFLNAMYDNFYASIEYNFMMSTISAMRKMISDGKFINEVGYNLNTSDGVTSFVEALNTVSRGMELPNTLYNYDGVLNRTTKDNIILVTTPDVWERVRVRGYSNVFNLDQYENKNRLVILPPSIIIGISGNQQIGALLMDKRALMTALKYYEVMPFNVANSDYRNTFAKVKLITGYTEFFQCVGFQTGSVGSFT